MEAAKEKSLLETILEQIKIIVVIYGIVIVIHMVSMGSPLPGLLKSTVVSFIMVTIAIVLKNVVKKWREANGDIRDIKTGNQYTCRCKTGRV